MQLISICIPVFNKYNFTKSCLNDLFRLPENQVQIIVVDNASTDSTQIELQKITKSNFKYIKKSRKIMVLDVPATKLFIKQHIIQVILYVFLIMIFA